MPKLMNIDKWIEQIDQTIDRLSKLKCDKCIADQFDRMVKSGIIHSWEYSDKGVGIDYIIQGQTVTKEL